MDMVVDASAFLAVALNEAEREWIIDVTAGATLATPAVLPYEIGNALVALVKRRRLSQDQAQGALAVTRAIPVRLLPVDVGAAMGIAFTVKSYAYDAYYLQCAKQQVLPLLTLDGPMRKAAQNLGIPLVE